MYNFLKRTLDILFSFLFFIILLPFFLIIMIFVKLTSRGPVFYLHERVGKGEKKFNVLKFRTMVYDNRPLNEILTPEQHAEYKENYKIKNDPRVTKFGKFLRKTSLDELPQLLNIIKGDMSFVGPRPVMTEEIDRLKIEDKKKYLSVLPGLTGYWAVNGRSATSYEKRLELELYYVEHKSIWLDIKIVFKTFFVFFMNSE